MMMRLVTSVLPRSKSRCDASLNIAGCRNRICLSAKLELRRQIARLPQLDWE
jgi:hypothetical protein